MRPNRLWRSVTQVSAGVRSALFHQFYRQSKSSGFDPGSHLNALSQHVSTCTSPDNTEIRHLLKGINNSTHRAYEHPAVWREIKAHFQANKTQYDPNTTSLLLCVMWRKRVEDQEFTRAVVLQTTQKIEKMDSMSLALAVEALARNSDLVTPSVFPALCRRIIELEEKLTSANLRQICAGLKYIQKGSELQGDVYKALCHAVLRHKSDMTLTQLAQCLSYFAPMENKLGSNLFNQVQTDIVQKVISNKEDPSLLPQVLNAYSQLHPLVLYQALFEKLGELILQDPDVYMARPMDFTTIVHCFSKAKCCDAVLRLAPKYIHTLSHLETQPYQLGVAICNLLRNPFNPQFLNSHLKPLFLKVAGKISVLHMKKGVLFLLRSSPEDGPFWEEFKSKVTLDLTPEDTLHFLPVSPALKSIFHLDLSSSTAAIR